MITLHTPKGQRILGAVLAAALLLALTVALNGRAGAQARSQTGGLSAPTEHASPAAIGTAFSYQGRLDDGGNPANGTYIFRFRLYESPTGTDQVGNTVIIEGVEVSDGLFSVQLDFGPVFDGTALYLEVAVRPADESGPFDVLSPRRPLSSVPYAVHAASIADGAVTASSIGEPCGEGQVLARLGGAWSCADAELNLAPPQLVSHTIQIENVTYPPEALQTDLLTLGSAYVVSGTGGLPLICLQPCYDLSYQWQECGSGSGYCPASPITVTVQSESSGLQYWVFDTCAPDHLSTALSPDGHDLYPVVVMTCIGNNLFYP